MLGEEIVLSHAHGPLAKDVRRKGMAACRHRVWEIGLIMREKLYNYV